MTVKLKPISKRAKNRIATHGNTFVLVQKGNAPLLQGNENSILVESLGLTWQGQKWLGWFALGVDVDVIEETK